MSFSKVRRTLPPFVPKKFMAFDRAEGRVAEGKGAGAGVTGAICAGVGATGVPDVASRSTGGGTKSCVGPGCGADPVAPILAASCCAAVACASCCAPAGVAAAPGGCDRTWATDPEVANAPPVEGRPGSGGGAGGTTPPGAVVGEGGAVDVLVGGMMGSGRLPKAAPVRLPTPNPAMPSNAACPATPCHVGRSTPSR